MKDKLFLEACAYFYNHPPKVIRYGNRTYDLINGRYFLQGDGKNGYDYKECFNVSSTNDFIPEYIETIIKMYFNAQMKDIINDV